jgi:ribosomal protein L14E/L6E/L27E
MGTDASNQMLALLQELAGLKEIDENSVTSDGPQTVAREERERRRTEVRAQIKQLAQDKNHQS